MNRHRWPVVVASIVCIVAALDAADTKPIEPLRQAHAHNDYKHAHPLHDALEHGFCSVEADIFLRDGQLLVGHTAAELKPGRTLEKLYLSPLRERIRVHRGRVYAGGPRFFLLIDVKSEAKSTYAALHNVLAGYAEMLTTYQNGKLTEKAVSVIVSGNRTREVMAAQAIRYACLDGRLGDLDSPEFADLVAWISDRWTSHFQWRGHGPIPENEREKLKRIVAKAHARGRLVRLWDTPESPAVWKELHNAGVDLINTDKLAELERFLREK